MCIMVTSDQLVEIAKRRGFFWQGSAIYGSLAGFYDYAHIGVFLKRRWENAWRKFFLGLDENYYEIQPSLIMHEKVFQASGHLESFADPIAKCGKCGNAERADHILEAHLKETFEGVSPEDLLGLIKINPEYTDLIFTGRHAPKKLIEKANLVTEMQEIKHPFQQGLFAKRGIDY